MISAAVGVKLVELLLANLPAIIDTAPKVVATPPTAVELPKPEAPVPRHRALRFWLLDLFSTERKP